MFSIKTTLIALGASLLAGSAVAAALGSFNGTASLSKRDFPNSRATYYDVGLGACGITNVPSDFIVALNTPQYGSGYPGPNCFKSIWISYGGKTATAQITDQCPGCPYGGLDLSQGLFEYFASTSLGVISVDWGFNDGSSQPTTTKAADPTTTQAASPTYVAPSTTSTTPAYTPPSTTQQAATIAQQQQATSSRAATTSAPAPSSSAASASSASSASAAMSSLQASLSSIPLVASSAPAASATAGSTGEVSTVSNLRTLSQVIVNLGSLVVVNAAGAK